MLTSLLRGPRRGHLRVLPFIVGCFIALGLDACGGGSGGSLTSNASMGRSVVTITDAAGDFLSYIVTLTSLQLQTASGASVETLPAATKVDFTKLVNLTEVLSAGQIPAADYVSAKLTLDFANAQITADDGTGKPVTLAPVDANGAAITGTVTLSVQLDNTNRLIITPGNTGRLAFDFNLAASNMVSLTAKTVQVAPTLVATVVPSDTKQVRVRGALVSANAMQNDFVLAVQPFAVQSATAGQVTVQVSATTTYQINGTAYVGTAGLTALAALAANTKVAAFGSLQAAGAFTATSVVAGTSLQNPAMDRVSGTVIARAQNTLTLRHATWTKPDDDFDFELADITVNVGANTVVTEEGQMGAFTAANISVGQHIDAFGMVSKGANGAVTVDATAGEVRLDITPLSGTVSALASGTLTVNLQSLDGMPVTAFNFAGTGTSAAMDSKPTAYVVNTGKLAQTGLVMNAPVRAFGFVSSFGMAPPDFTAETLENFAAVPSDLVVDWGRAGSAGAFTGLTATSTSLQLSLTNVGNLHLIKLGPELIDLTKLAMPPSIVPATAMGQAGMGQPGMGQPGMGQPEMGQVFAIGHAGKFKTDNFNTFGGFVAQLAADLAGAGMPTVVAIAATGQYDAGKNVFTAQRLVVLLSN